jgi:hypothetical protein
VTLVFDAWLELNQGGRLLDRRAFETLPEPGNPPANLGDHLRDALTESAASRTVRPQRRSTASGREAESLGTLLEVVLEEACGLKEGWTKGPQVGAAEAVTLLDGTVLKPRRILTLGGETALGVFVASADRIGLHQGKRVVAQVVEYLRKRQVPLGLLTNGQEWRLIFTDADNLAWVEWAADRWLEGDSLTRTLQLLRRVLSPASLEPIPVESGEPGSSRLLLAIRQTRRGQARLSKELGERVRACVELLLHARRPVLEPSWNEAESKSVYDAACHFVMRLVVVLFAEARELLPVDSSVYHQAYGLRGLLEALERAGAERRKSRTSAWPRLLALFRLLHQGSPHPQLSVTAYGGDLFRPGDAAADAVQRALALLESVAESPDDETLYRMLVLLTRTTERIHEGSSSRIVAAPVDFTELTSEYIGILYEGLLDYELHRVESQPIVFLGLGDQPALPLDRLEAMSDKQLASLVEKATIKREAASEEDDGEEEDDDAETDGSADDEPTSNEPKAGGDTAAFFEDLAEDDVHAQAMRRALAWAERAALAGRLKKAPRGKKGSTDPAWQAELARAAQDLIAREEVEPGKWRPMVKLPGELYLVRWGGTRKGAGTFYTRPQLTLPTVRRTLEPLLSGPDGRLRPPEELLALKVCDPAMGSGSFLVASLRVLTESVVRSLHEHGRIVRRENAGPGDLVRIECDLLPESDRDQSYDRVEAIVRRAVVEHCLYGVDLDSLAVELARVSLWVETLDRHLPFTFLDHKLRPGDALVGTWLDRFRDYPLLAWWRQSPDEKWRGVTHKGDLWANALKEKRKAVVAEQAELLDEQKSRLGKSVSDDELKAAIERVRELYRRLRKVPASQPDKRADIWRKQVAPDPALARVREAFDTWCALWFWPLDQLDMAPGPAELPSPSGEARELVRELRKARRFFHWELEFPDVFNEKGAGFDVVVGNPPWDTLQAQSKEYFSERDPLYRSYGKLEALSRQRELFAQTPSVERRWLEKLALIKNMVNFVRHVASPYGGEEDAEGRIPVALVPRKAKESHRLHQRWAVERAKKTGLSDPRHPFQCQGEGKPYSYKLFVEQSHALLKPGGQLGLVTPSGLYSDKGSVDLRKLLLERCTWRWLYGFENRNQLFDIHRSFKLAVTIAEKGGQTQALQAAFMRHELEDWAEAKGTLEYPAERIQTFSPKSLSVLESRSARDLEVLTRIYEASTLLGDERADGTTVGFRRDFNMTDDAAMFPSRERWEDKGYEPDELGLWRTADGSVALPLLQGGMVWHFDCAFQRWVGSEWSKGDSQEILPKNLLALSDLPEEDKGLLFAFRDIARGTDQRTAIGTLVPGLPSGNSLGLLTGLAAPMIFRLLAVFNSFSFDWVTRERIGGTHLNWYIGAELPVPQRAWEKVAAVLDAPVRRLGMVPPLFAPFWLANGNPEDYSRRALTRHERLRLRCILDAVVPALYGLTRADLSWLLRDCDHPLEALANKDFCRKLDAKGFWRIDKNEPPELRHTVLSLVAFDALEKLIDQHGGNHEAGIAAFFALNGGEGWLIPDTLRLADYGLGRDERARVHQPVASVLGARFLDSQLAQSPAESWAECESHARAILGGAEFERRFAKPKTVELESRIHIRPAISATVTVTSATPQLSLFETRPAAPSATTEPSSHDDLTDPTAQLPQLDE